MRACSRSLRGAPPLHRALLEDDVRASVASSVQHRVPLADAEDVAQAVFCAALDSDTPPSNPLEIPLWLAGIARHRVVDYFRRRSPETCIEVEPRLEPPDFEVREGVSRLLGRVAGDREKLRTLGWMLLEQEGVPFNAIARAEKLSAGAVRARVFRLRRWVRAELAYLLVGVVLLAGVGPSLKPWLLPFVGSRVSQEGSGPRLPSWIEGEYQIAQIEPAGDVVVAPATQALVAEATGARVSVRGSELEVRTASLRLLRSLTVRSLDGSSVELSVVDAAGHAWPVSARLDGDRLRVRSSGGPFRGTLLLERIDRSVP